ncbi:MAG TPA: carboxypeptidase regulatory-like domain-containing protein [Vicinamibacterales bacterium]|nr:carboxypeptidase regulatory-like domain-containing protein [Vicinamibacterales bacterium]
MRVYRTAAGLLAAVLLMAAGAAAQSVTGEIRGTVRDSSGGVLPGVTVTVTNTGTGLTRTDTTSDTGTYVFPSLPIGTYTVSAELQGFRKAERAGFALVADGRITADFSLGVGSVTETITVEAVRGDTVNRTSGEVQRVVDGETVRSLALSGRNYLELATLIPGAITTDDDQMAVTTGLGTGGVIINGNRGNSNNLTVDGGFNLDSGSNSSMINNVGIDFIEQVAIQTSNFAADKGRNAGASINVVTRSGTNQIKGSVFETYRNDRFHAANHFAPRDASGKRIKAKEDFNDYGGGIGGPLVRNKLFFFGGVEFKSLDRQESPLLRTLPSRAELNGDFSARSVVIRDPLTGQQFQGNVIPANRITPDGRAIAKVYERMIGLAATYTDAPTANNTVFQLDFPFDWRQDLARIDYRRSQAHSFYLRYLHDKYDLIEPRGTFIGSAMPTIPTNRVRPGYGIQLAHTWIVRENLFNDFKATSSWNGQRIPPAGDNWKRETYGFQFPQVYNRGRYDAEGIPRISFSGTGAPAQIVGPSQSLLSPTTDITFTNALTWIKSAHTLRSGVIITRNRKDQNGRNQHTGDVSFNPTGNPNTTGFAFADALLGNFRSYSEGGDDPLGFFRFTQYGGYVSDTWRVRNDLSLEMGLRYEYQQPIYTQGNNITNFDPALYNPAHAMVLNPNGSVASLGVNRYTGLVTAGNGIPEDQKNRVTLDPVAAALIPGGAPRGLYKSYHLIMPRFSGAYTLRQDWVVRGGVGLFYDKPEGNVIFSQVNLPPFVPSINVENGNLANPLAGAAAAASVLGNITALQPDMKVPRQLQYSVGVQRELPAGHFAEITYVGNKGRHLLWQPNINVPTFEVELANQLLPSTQRANTNYLRPYSGYSDITQRRSDAFSDYNSLQLYLNKRRGRQLTYSVSYTLGKVTGLGSGNGDSPLDDEGWRPTDNVDFSYFVGPTSFDRRHSLLVIPTYTPAFMRDRRDVLGQILGGWEISGKIRWQSGQYLTPTGNTLIGVRRADVVPGQDIDLDDRSEAKWFNTAAFVAAPVDRRGTARVGMIQGPHWRQADVSLRKRFRIARSKSLEVRADVFNVLNTVNLGNPNTQTDSNNYGRITSARIPRQSQFSLRFQF